MKQFLASVCFHLGDWMFDYLIEPIPNQLWWVSYPFVVVQIKLMIWSYKLDVDRKIWDDAAEYSEPRVSDERN